MTRVVRFSLVVVLVLTAAVSDAHAQWTTDRAPNGDRVAQSGISLPTTTGGFEGSESAALTRALVVCSNTDNNHVVGLALPQGIQMAAGTMPLRVTVDAWRSSLSEGIVAQNVIIIGSSQNGLVSRIIAGNTLRVRIGNATGYMTWSWPLRGSGAAIRSACRM